MSPLSAELATSAMTGRTEEVQKTAQRCRSAAERHTRSGRDEDLQKGTTMQNPSRRDFVSGSVAAALGALSPLTGSVAAEKSNDWTERTEDVGIDRAAIRKILEDARSVTALRSIVVVKNESLVGQQYYGGVTAADLHGVNSVTKSVASMLVGIAVQQGKIKSLSETVGDLLPTSAAKAPGEAVLGITLEQILTDTSGLVYDFRTDVRALGACRAFPAIASDSQPGQLGQFKQARTA